MSKNIKEIGKELLGKSLNSFHRKTGLTQLEKNNEMQDGILNGILSQVDNAYIEKTEQSNVIHLDGSGDGVVVLDSIEGNTVVNLIGTALDDTTYYTKNPNGSIDIIKHNTSLPPFNNDNYHNLNLLKPNTQYTLVVMGEYSKIKILLRDYFIDENGINNSVDIKNMNLTSSKTLFTTNNNRTYMKLLSAKGSSPDDYPIQNIFVMILEGDWTNKEIPTSYIEGLQSSFEEKVNDEDKYEIEILSKNKNLYNVEDANIGSWMNSGGATVSKINNNIVLNGTISDYFDFRTVQSSWNANLTKLINKLPTGTTLTMSNNLTSEKNTINYWSVRRDGVIKYFTNTLTIQKGDTEIGGFVRFQNGTVLNNTILKVQIEVNNKATSYTISKQNKIKLLLNSSLLKGDKLVVKDGKLCHYHKMKKIILNGSDNESWIFAPSQNTDNTTLFYIRMLDAKSRQEVLCDKFGQRRKNHDLWASSTETDYEAMFINHNRDILTRISTSKLSSVSMSGFKQWLKTNNVTVIYELEEPYYEDVLNEYGEPILIEGYENGTLYIDSTIVPTTTVRYTPKMESFKTLKEVKNNNIMLTNDVNDNIIPYMMDVDLMIMEKEMALMSHKNIRKMEVLDMTSMQKRTQDMLERLIKGKTLTEQECKTRVTTYLHAGKITDEQAEELMLLIDEVYA